MARDVSDRGRRKSGGRTTENGDFDGNGGLLDRRSYLKLASGTMAAAAFAGAGSASEYETITIEPDEYRVIEVGSGETFENKLIDMTAEGAAALVTADGRDWTIRNVGFKGAISGDHRAMTAADTGGNSVIENVYMGDGAVGSSVPSDQYAPALGLWVSPDHSGHLDVRNVYVEGALDNAFYCSAASGTVHIDGCYAKNNAISDYRLGSSGSKVTNSVAVGGSNTHRGVWAWAPGPVKVEDCHLVMNGEGQAIVAGANGDGTTVECRNVQYSGGDVNERNGSTVNLDGDSGSDARDFVPDGCPTSPEEAASGDGDYEPTPTIGDRHGHPYTIEFDGEGTFFFATRAGAVDLSGVNDEPVDEHDDVTIEDNRVYGHVDGSVVFEYEEYLADVGTDGDVETLVDDSFEPTWEKYPTDEAPENRDWVGVDPWASDDGDDGDDEDGEDEHLLRMEGACEYYIEVSESLRPAESIAEWIEEGEQYGEDWADWYLTGSWTEWHFTGEFERFDLENVEGLTVYVDGEEVDPDELVEGDDPEGSLLLVEGTDEDTTRYEFTVDGEVETANEHGDSTEDEIEIDDGRVHSVVGDWTDAFRIVGDLEELYVHGPATVSLDGEEIDPDEYGEDLPHLLEVEGRGFPASFEVTVDGTIEAVGGDADEGTASSGSTVEGTVVDDAKRFRFGGALTDVTFVEGIATVVLDGEEIDPEEYGDQNLFPHAVVFDGTDAGGQSTYAFDVDGRVVKSEYRDASIDESDVLDGRSVDGSLGNWLDAYWFDGDLRDLTVDGDARVHVEYNAREQ